MNDSKIIQEILRDVSRWLRFQKCMGLEYLPNDKELCSLLHMHTHGSYRAAGAAHGEYSPVPIQQKNDLAKIQQQPPQATVSSKAVPSFQCKDFNELQSALAACPGCEAAGSKRPVSTKPVRNPKVLVVTDVIDYEEELEGGYFTRSATELLDKMLAAIDIPLHQAYLTGLFKCRTSVKPKRADVERCAGFLMAEIELLKPKAILSFTPLLSWPLFGKTASLSRLREKSHLIRINNHELTIFFTHSPNTILKTTGNAQKALKIEAWKDLQKLQKALEKAEKNT